MDTRQTTLLLGAALALAGVIVGSAAVVSGSRTIAFSGANPGAMKEMLNPRLTVRNLADYEPYARFAYPDIASYARLEQVYGSAPEIEGFDLSHCEGLSRSRLTNCIVEYLNTGVIYQHGQRNRDIFGNL